MPTPKELHEEGEKNKLAAMPREVKDATIASAKEMLDKGQITQKHFDTIAANMK